MPGWHHANAAWKPKICVVCSTEFIPKSGVNKFCSSQCKGKWKYITGVASTENQYKAISGDWRRYCARLMYHGGRKRDKLTVEIILGKLAKQNYLCALTGKPLTCMLEKGVISPTNASIDRIIAGGPYTEDNIQIVCRAVNLWRGATPIPEFVDWCRAVVNHYESHTSQAARGKGEESHGEIA
jgi:hypothetical protein